MNLTGLHHVTAVTGNIQDNLKFYTEVLGLRLVKKSVNQDDTSAYHLFYADKLGTPGTDLTFFDWPKIGPNREGTDSILGTAFRVSGCEALEFWSERLTSHGITPLLFDSPADRELIAFEDPEGKQLFLVNDQNTPMSGKIWSHPEIPDEFAIKGLYSTVISTPAADELIPIFSDVLNFQEVKRGTWIDGHTPLVIFQTLSDGGPGTEIWLLLEPGKPRAKLGAGGVHHVAFRVDSLETQKEWQKRLQNFRLHVTQSIDRFWFRSIYFRVSGGILFEIATDGPGFDIDEDPDSLGEKLVLPPFLEDQRDEIEANLIPIGDS